MRTGFTWRSPASALRATAGCLGNSNSNLLGALIALRCISPSASVQVAAPRASICTHTNIHLLQRSHRQRIKSGEQTAKLSLTYTAHPCGVEFKIGWAVTVVISWDVDTDSINAGGWVCTFIYIWKNKT